MGMIGSKIEIMFVTQENKKLFWEAYLVDEDVAELVGDKHAFDSVSSADEFAECVGKCFKDAFFEDDEPNYIKQYPDEYKKLKKIIKSKWQEQLQIKSFKKVVLLATEPLDDHCRLNYLIYNLDGKNIGMRNGAERAEWGKGDYEYGDPDYIVPKVKDFLKTLV